MRSRSLAAVALLAVSAAALAVPASAGVSPATSTVMRASSAGQDSVSITRTHLVGGDNKVVDRRRVTVNVDTNTGLRDRQAINVSWTGAHPTGGIVADQNSGSAATQQEYPMVLMQCRGVDSASAPPAKRIRPESCWTQTPYERFSNEFNSPVPAWRLDRYAPDSERKQYVNAPKKRPADCFGAAQAERWVPFVAVSGKTYPGGPNGCAGTAPEATTLGGLNLPSNTTYASTATNGRGSATFNVRTSVSNASLGCSSKVPCSLVAIPVMGISCDSDAKGLPEDERPVADDLTNAAARCEADGNYAPGANFNPSIQAEHAVTGSLWWSASNWRNRLSIPLHFAELANACDITRSGGLPLFGSELMIQATEQWAPRFCLDPNKTPIKHVQMGEPQARNLLRTSGIDAALISNGPGEGETYDRPVVHAPVAMTGFAITYAIDGENGRAYTTLKLNPRLLAKLLTASYPAITAVKTDYNALSDNPLNITSDPEFLALNPGVKQDVSTQSAATILSLSSDSDVIKAVTSYIDTDPEARAWLDGEPDPWGMKVNPNYKGIDLPVDVWQSLDTFQPTAIYKPGVNDCLYEAPVPYLPLVAAPLTRLSNIALAMQFSLANSQVVCTLPSGQTGSTEGAKLVSLGRQTPGFRFMIGLSSLADADRYEIRTAALQTTVDDKGDAFSSANGRTFVQPNETSLKAAGKLLTPVTSTDTWELPYDKILSDANAETAYPGSMVVYAAVPTKGLSSEDGHAYADWVRFAATDGQEPGTGIGKLPAGYLPMTSANGLGGLVKSSLLAAKLIAAQQGGEIVIPPDGKPDDPLAPQPNGGPFGDPTPPGSDVPGGPNGPDEPKANDDPPTDVGPTVPLGTTTAGLAGPAGVIVPFVLGLALVAGLLAGMTLLRARLKRAS